MSTRNKACTQCQKARKKCEIQADYSHCQRCFSLGIPQLCQFEVKPKSKDTLAPQPCRRCSKNRWRCILIPGQSACRLCQSSGNDSDCIFEVEVSTTSQSEPSPTEYQSYSSTIESTISLPSDSSSLGASALDHIIHAFDQPLNTTDMMIEDPDLMPTMDDFVLAWSFCTANGTQPPLWFGMDGDHFLRTFFSQPPYLRLALCAFAAHSRIPPLPEPVCFSLFQRARKAIFRMEGNEVCVEMVKALTYLFLFSMHKGQPSIGRKFLERGAEILLELRLDVDPDDSPWLFPLNLTPRQKEDRRRAFWALYGWFITDLGLNPDASFTVPLSDNGVKPPHEVVDQGQRIFERSPSVKWSNALSKIVYKNRQILMNPPQSITALIESATHQDLESSFNDTLLKCADLVLYAESPFNITEDDSSRFKQQLVTNKVFNRYLFQVYAFNFSLLATISVLNRPRLYVTCLRSCHPRFLSSKHQQIVLLAATQCLDSAHRTANLFFFAETDCLAGFGPAVFTQLIYYLLEAAIVCWFVTCRMNSGWRSLLDPQLVERKRLLRITKKMAAFVQKVVDLEGAKSGPTSAIYQCLLSMVPEMVKCCEVDTEEEWRTSSELEGVEISMTVTSLVGDEIEKVEKEPHSHLGLLGLDIAGGVRWKGNSEPAWRLFWKLND